MVDEDIWDRGLARHVGESGLDGGTIIYADHSSIYT